MRMGILANVAEFESARKAERVARAAEQRAAAGRPHGRPSFGWKLDPAGEWVIDHDAALLIRDAAKRVLIGEGAVSIVADFNEQGLPTPAVPRGDITVESAGEDVRHQRDVPGHRPTNPRSGVHIHVVAHRGGRRESRGGRFLPTRAPISGRFAPS
jgi:hypothetical protein